MLMKNWSKYAIGLLMVVLTSLFLLGSTSPAMASETTKPDSFIELIANRGGRLGNARVEFALGQKDPLNGKIRNITDKNGKTIIINSLAADDKGFIDLGQLVKNEDNLGKIRIDNSDVFPNLDDFISLNEFEEVLREKDLLKEDGKIDTNTLLLFRLSGQDQARIGASQDSSFAYLEVFVPQSDYSYGVKEDISALYKFDTRTVRLDVQAVKKGDDGKLIPITGADFVLVKKSGSSSEKNEEIEARSDAKGRLSFVLYSDDFELTKYGARASLTSPFVLKQKSSEKDFSPYSKEIIIGGDFDKNGDLISSDKALSMSYTGELDPLLFEERINKISLNIENYSKVKVANTNQPNGEIIRIAGSNRYTSSVEFSKAAYPDGAKTVILASGENTADALAAGPLAIKEDGPILLTAKTLPGQVKAEIERLKPDEIILVGGPAWIPEDIQKELGARRISGSNRYETAMEIAKEMGAEKLILANGENSVDALAVAGYAGKNGLAIGLTESEVLSEPVDKYIKENNINHVEIVGGKASVSENIAKNLGDIFVKRIFGIDRVETARRLAEITFEEDTMVVIANGSKGLVDALAAGPYAFKNKAPILLTDSGGLNRFARNYMLLADTEKIVVCGGINTISESIVKEIEDRAIAKPKGKVVVYTTSTCPACRYFKEFLAKYKVEYTEKDVSANPEYRAEFDAKGFHYVPSVIVGDVEVSNFDMDKIGELLGF